MSSATGNSVSGSETTPWSAPPNADVSNEQTMTSTEAQAARAKAAEVMAALKKGDQGEADKLMGKQEKQDSLIPGMGKLKEMLLGKKKEKKVEVVR